MAEHPPMIWMDLEMTGLDPEHNVIIEMATLVTDSELQILAEGPVFAIHHGEAELDKMDEWNWTHHGGSGLVDRVRASTVSTAQAEAETLAFLQGFAEPGQAPLCGNSIHQDRRFLRRHMPTLEAFFHYRLIDVSTVKGLAARWYPEAYAGVQKQGRHLALDDIRDSIAELAHYRRTIFKAP